MSGIKEERQKIIKKMLEQGLKFEEIQQFVEVDSEELEDIAKLLN